MEKVAEIVRAVKGLGLETCATLGMLNGAVLADMGLDPLLGRGLALVGRAAGLVAHVCEESRAPTGQQLWDLVLRQDPRNLLPARG